MPDTLDPQHDESQPEAAVPPKPEEETLPDASVLEDRTPPWFRSRRGSSIFLTALGLTLIVLFANRPLWHTDLWDHVNYGCQILETRQLADTEPLLPLAEGIPIVDSAWGSKLIFAAITKTGEGSLPALQFLHGLTVIFAMGAIGYVVWLRSESLAFAMAASGIMLAIGFYQLLIIRPQTMGVLFFSLLLALLTTKSYRRPIAFWGIPVAFIVWVNLHGSFAIGLTLMALVAIGSLADSLVRTRSLKMAVLRPDWWRLLLTLQLSSVACLLNPWGLRIYAEVFRVAQHVNIKTMFEWDPLTLRGPQGPSFLVATVLLFVVSRLSPRRFRAAEWLPVLFFAVMSCWSARMLNWFGPTVAIVLGIHGAASWRAVTGQRRPDFAMPPRGLWTVVNLGLCWIFFGFTALGAHMVHGRTPELRRSVSRETPVEVTELLNQEPDLITGLTFIPAEWAGYMMHAGPEQLQSMVNLHVHVIPEEVWSGYLRISQGANDAEGLLDRYEINLLVADLQQNENLIRRIDRLESWKRIYSDHQAAVYQRVQP